VSPFVEECLREWKRLGVPDPVANEMAADLAADLAEAEADGTSPEEVLGSGVFDARSFAAAWASERGIVPAAPQPSAAPHRRRRWLMPALVALFALIALVGAVLAIRGNPPRNVSVRVALPAGGGPTRFHFVAPGRLRALPRLRPGPGAVLVPPSGQVTVVNVRPIGIVLLIVGLIGAAVSLVIWAPWRRPTALSP
jgi:hypothetical protein